MFINQDKPKIYRKIKSASIGLLYYQEQQVLVQEIMPSIGWVIILVKMSILNTRYQAYLILIFLEFLLLGPIFADLIKMPMAIYVRGGII